MSIQRFYNIHSLIYIKARGDRRLCDDLDFHLKPFKRDSLDKPPDIIIDRFDASPPTSRTTVVDDYEFGMGGYRREQLRIRFDFSGSPQTYYMDRLAQPINLILELALLRKGFTFLHGAGLSIDGRQVLFLAYPGTGKTTLVSAFVRAGGALFGDDLCIVGNGKIYAYPQALSVYPHHLPVLGYSSREIEKAFARAAMINRIRSPLAHSNNPIAKLLRIVLSTICPDSVNIAPELVFGKQAMASEGTLNEVVALERSGEIDTLVREKVDLGDLVDQASIILWHEWHNSFHDLLLYDALAESGRGMTHRIRQVRDLAYKSFQNIPFSRVRIPASWDNTKLVKEFPIFWKKSSD